MASGAGQEEALNPFSNGDDGELMTLAMIEADVEEYRRMAAEAGEPPDPEWDRWLRQARAMHMRLATDDDPEPEWFEYPDDIEEME